MKKIILILSILCLIFLASCQISIDKGDTDTEKDTLTDFGTNTGKDTSSSDISTDTEIDVDTNINAEKIYVITVQDQDGIAVSGATVTIFDKLGDTVKELITNEKGKATCSLNGEYLLDITSLPDGYTDNSPVTSLMENTIIIVENNNPNGTEKRPYYLSNGITPIALEARENQYYLINGDNQVFRIMEAEGLSVTYEGTEYTPNSEDIISFIMNKNEAALIEVENTLDVKRVCAIEVFYQKTDMDKAEAIRLHTEAEALVSSDESKYFKWAADRDGMVMVLSMVENNDISLYNKNNNMWSENTNGAMCEYIYASEDDEIYVKVSATTKEQTNVVFAIYSYNSTIIDDPIPLIKKSTDMSLLPNQRFYFVIDAREGILNVQGEIGKLYYNSEEYDVSEINDLQVSSENNQMPIFFELENKSEEVQTYTITID